MSLRAQNPIDNFESVQTRFGFDEWSKSNVGQHTY